MEKKPKFSKNEVANSSYEKKVKRLENETFLSSRRKLGREAIYLFCNWPMLVNVIVRNMADVDIRENRWRGWGRVGHAFLGDSRRSKSNNRKEMFCIALLDGRLLTHSTKSILFHIYCI